MVHKRCFAAGNEDEHEQSLTGSSIFTVAAVLADAVSCPVPEMNAIAVRQVTEILLRRCDTVINTLLCTMSTSL